MLYNKLLGARCRWARARTAIHIKPTVEGERFDQRVCSF